MHHSDSPISTTYVGTFARVPLRVYDLLSPVRLVDRETIFELFSRQLLSCALAEPVDGVLLPHIVRLRISTLERFVRPQCDLVIVFDQVAFNRTDAGTLPMEVVLNLASPSSIQDKTLEGLKRAVGAIESFRKVCGFPRSAPNVSSSQNLLRRSDAAASFQRTVQQHLPTAVSGRVRTLDKTRGVWVPPTTITYLNR